MTDKERELKSFNQCADALSSLDKRSILKVFHMLSIHFEVVEHLISNPNGTNNKDSSSTNENNTQHLLEPVIEEQKTQTNKEKTSARKIKSTNSKTPTYLTDFNFKPSDNKSLKDFYSEYEVKTNYENNLIFTYYLQELLKTTSISTNHIYSCFRHLGLKVPSFPQILKDTRTRKGWLDVSNTNDIKVTREGLNYMQHDLPKNNNG
jgi:hypothetical protein